MELGNEQSFKAEEENNEKRAQEPSQAISEKTSSRSRSGTRKGSKGSRKISHGDERLLSQKMDCGYKADDPLQGPTEPTHWSNECELGIQLDYKSHKMDPGFYEDFRVRDPTEPHDESVGLGVEQKRRKILPTIFACFGGFGREKEEKKSGTEKGEPGLRE